MDITNVESESKQAREELSHLLNNLINQPLIDAARSIADDNLYQLKGDLQSLGGNLRKQINDHFTTTNDDLCDALYKVRLAVSKISSELTQAEQNTLKQLDIQQLEYNTTIATLSAHLEKLMTMAKSEHEHLQKAQLQHSFRFKILSGLLLMNLVGITVVLFNLFLG